MAGCESNTLMFQQKGRSGSIAGVKEREPFGGYFTNRLSFQTSNAPRLFVTSTCTHSSHPLLLLARLEAYSISFFLVFILSGSWWGAIHGRGEWLLAVLDKINANSVTEEIKCSRAKIGELVI